MAQRTYAIIGAGALGGFYGARLQRAGFEVHFLLHSDYQFVRQHGLFVESKDGDFELTEVHAYEQARNMPRCDVVVVALKTTRNGLLADLLPPVLKDEGVVLMLQNGLGNEAEAAKIVGDDRVLGGLCFLCSNKVGPGHILHLDYGRVTFGEHTRSGLPGGISLRLKQIAGDFQAAGLETLLTDDLLLSRWKKLVWNVPFNGLTVVLDTTTDQIMLDQHSRALAEALMLDVLTGAAACGKTIPYEFVQQMLQDTDHMTPYQTSMKVDFDLRRPMEIESIVGNPLRAAERAGVELSRLAILYRQLKFLEAHNHGPRE